MAKAPPEERPLRRRLMWFAALYVIRRSDHGRCGLRTEGLSVLVGRDLCPLLNRIGIRGDNGEAVGERGHTGGMEFRSTDHTAAGPRQVAGRHRPVNDRRTVAEVKRRPGAR